VSSDPVVSAGADGCAGASPTGSRSKRDDAGSSDGDGGASGGGDIAAGGGKDGSGGCGGDDARSGADDTVAADVGAEAGAGVGSSDDASGVVRGALTGAAIRGGGRGGSFAGGVLGSNGGGSVGVLTWSRIEDDSSGIEDDSPGLGARSNDEICFVVGDGGGSANARAWLPSPTLGPSSIAATSSPTNPCVRMRAPFNRSFRIELIEVEPRANLGVNPGHA
jgi:hypothetical protein